MFQIIGRLLFAGFILIVGCALPLMSRAADEDTWTVIISEINWGGSSISSADEWIELTNLTNETIDLSGWTIQGAASSNGTLTLPSDSTIEPYSTFLISNYDELNTKSALVVTPKYVTTGISLSNSRLSLMLVDGTGERRDAANDGSKPFSGRVGATGTGSDGGGFASMVRTWPVRDGTVAGSWTDAVESVGFDEEVEDMGSPGNVEGGFEMVEIGPSNGLQEIEEVEESMEVEEVINITVSEDSEEVVKTEEIIETTESVTASDTPSDGVNTTQSSHSEVEVTEINPEEIASPTEDQMARNHTMDHTETERFTYPTGTLLINELVSDADVEWVEIVNPYNNIIPLLDWSVRDASGKQTELPDQLLGMGQFVVLKNPKGKLNNTGDKIELLDPNSVIIDAVTYGTEKVLIAKKPNSLARNVDGEWVVTTSVTMGEVNILSPVILKVPVENSKPKASIEKINSKIEALNPKKIEKVKIQTEVEKKEEIIEPMTLRLSEIYPNTMGSDLMEEFIEIENYGSEPVPMDGWVLIDAGKKIFSFDSTSEILPQHFLTLSREETHIALNNTSDTLALFAPDATLIDSLSYESPPKGSSYILVGSVWNWSTDHSPDEPNDVSTDEVVGPARVATASTYRKGVKAVSSWIEGTVLVGPGVFGKQIFYLMTEAGGLQIYKYDADFPDMDVGDQISVTGTFTESRGERRLKIGSSDEILITGSHEPIDSEPIELASLSQADHGRLVTVTGTVVSRAGKKIILENNGVQLTIRVADGTDIDAATFARGAEMEVTGLVVAANKTITLLPRTKDDVVLTTPPITEQTIVAATGKETRSSTDRSIAFAITILTILGLTLYSWIHLIPKWKLLYAKHRAVRTASQTAR